MSRPSWLRVVALALIACPIAVAATNSPDPRVRLNTIGFLPAAPKRATIAATCDEFRVVRESDGQTVFTGRVGAPVVTAPSDTDETVRIADFTTLSAPGRYRIDVPGVGASAPFAIAGDVWNAPFALVTRGFYLWRCGTAVEADWNGVHFAHAACHLDDGWLDEAGGGHVKLGGVGGWHDAGDYNKYVVNAGVSVGLLLAAWEQFRGPLASVSLHLPESGNGTPDLLNEVRWEIEWLLKMQQEDGRVYHKLSALNFNYWGPAEKDPSPRFISPWGSTATADFTAMLAKAARAFREFDPKFADRCLAAAQRSWAFLVAHPENVAADQHAFKTGEYGSADATPRLWAAAEIWVATRDAAALHEFERRAAKVDFSASGPTWPDVHDLALATYLLAANAPERDAALVARLKQNLVARGESIVAMAESNGYGRPLGGNKDSWSWGGNGTVAGQTFILQVANRVQPDARFPAAAQHALAFLFGRNFHGRSYVTGLGANPPEHPHDRRGEPAWPGYLVGGGWPNGRSWVDEKENYRVNEIAINWNAALTYALGAFVEVVGVTRDGQSIASGGADAAATPSARATTLTYSLTNHGSAPLVLDRWTAGVATGCQVECTPPARNTLAPGESTNLIARVTPANTEWRAELAVAYNGDAANPFRWTARALSSAAPSR
ncbi:MAG TPA: glycoside hydrolase family 9 protein [Opitutaceae bacterium]|nr:glycoside hydrolase family 9 protein [Opitutaceae bacterium]